MGNLPRETAVELTQDRVICAEGIRTGGQNTQSCWGPENKTTSPITWATGFGACSAGCHPYSAPTPLLIYDLVYSFIEPHS